MQHVVKIAAAIPQIVAECQLAKVQRQIFDADGVKLTDESALHSHR